MTPANASNPSPSPRLARPLAARLSGALHAIVPWLRAHPNLVLLAGALVLGGAAMLMTDVVIDTRVATVEQRLREGQTTVRVVVARADLPRGTAVTAAAFVVRELPAEGMHASAVRPEQFDRIERQRLASALNRGEPLLLEHLDGAGGAVFSALLRPGRRALTVEVDDRNAIAGLLRPGDRVDLLLSVAGGQGGGGTASFAHPAAKGAGARGGAQEVTWPLLDAVEVLATGQSVRRSDAAGAERSYSNVTLDVSPQDAQRIIVARSAGVISASLRHPDDLTASAVAPLALDDVLGIQRTTAPRAAPRGVEMLVGNSDGTTP